MDSNGDISVINLHSSENDLESDSNANAKSTPKKRKIVPIYKQNFNEHWLQDVKLKDWLKKTDGPRKALCRYGDITFSASKKCDLLRQKQTTKHESNVAAAKKSTKMTQFFPKLMKQVCILVSKLQQQNYSSQVLLLNMNCPLLLLIIWLKL